MTGKQICEQYARFNGVPESDVPAWARNFWEAGPRGDLFHVFAARDEMRAAGFMKDEGPTDE
jgi:hypothetical protein